MINIAYVLENFPSKTEYFVLNEILELENLNASIIYRPKLISYIIIFKNLKENFQFFQRSCSEHWPKIKNILKNLESNIKNSKYDSEEYISRLIELLKIYPADLRIGIMKDIRNSYTEIYKHAIEKEAFESIVFIVPLTGISTNLGRSSLQEIKVHFA